MASDILGVVKNFQEELQSFAIATVIETVGSVSAKTASKAVIDKEGRVVAGWIGGGCAGHGGCRACRSSLCATVDGFPESRFNTQGQLWGVQRDALCIWLQPQL